VPVSGKIEKKEAEKLLYDYGGSSALFNGLNHTMNFDFNKEGRLIK
jgi:hypothetical protein